jgi:hypothetical protein
METLTYSSHSCSRCRSELSCDANHSLHQPQRRWASLLGKAVESDANHTATIHMAAYGNKMMLCLMMNVSDPRDTRSVGDQVC